MCAFWLWKMTPSRHDESGAAAGRQMLRHVVGKQHLAPLGLDGEAVVGADAAFRRHERRVGQDDVGALIPTIVAREGVILGDVRADKLVQVHIDA